MLIRVNCPGGLIYESTHVGRRIRASHLALDAFQCMGLEGWALQLCQGETQLTLVNGANTKEPEVELDSYIDLNEPSEEEWPVTFALSVDSEW